jgi:hypothetical protein
MFKGVLEGGFLRVALKDVNQYGPHAMIMLLFVVATVTALALLLSATITPWFALQAVVFVFSVLWVWFWRLRRLSPGDIKATLSNGP